MHLKDTIGLCPVCYKHIPGEIIQESGKVYLRKECAQHGLFTSLLENSADFYASLKVTPNYVFSHKVVTFDVTNKCNLKCPNCYQLPDNATVDKSQFEVLNEIAQIDKSIPYKIMLAGAEVTMRRDLPNLMTAIGKEFNVDSIVLLSNGVAFSKAEYVTQLYETGLMGKTIVGLNHWSYQGKTVHTHQLRGIDNLNSVGIVPTISYTVENFSHLNEVLDQSQDLFNRGKIQLVRIRSGSNIGRSNEVETLSLSVLVDRVKNYCQSVGWNFTSADGENKLYHHNFVINDMPVVLEHWPNVDEIELHSCQTGPYAHFINGPVTNYYHQIVLRDAYINKKLPRLDSVPKEFTREYILGIPASQPRSIFNIVPA